MMKTQKIITLIGSAIMIAAITLTAAGCGDDPAPKKETAPAATAAAPAPQKEIKQEPAHRTGKEITGVSDKNIDDMNIHFSKSVPNDKTGKWRIATTSTSADFPLYARSYVEKYFKSNDEVHIVVNFATNTTTVINNFGPMVDITIHEYVKGEEHDAAKIGGGMVYSQYWVYLDNGDIEKIK